jgi:molybdate/tungstate transport system substrate-binding protein
VNTTENLTRRELLASCGRITLAVVGSGFSLGLSRTELPVIEVAYAGSMGSMMEGPVKTAVAEKLKFALHGRGQGSNALAQLIASGSIRPDVFIAVTPGPMLTVLLAGKAARAKPVARTEMVIAYSPASRFAPQLDAAARGKAIWWQVLEEPGLRFGRTDPVSDPQGRNIIFTMMLAARLYKQPKLVEKILGSAISESQIFSEPTLQARLQSGQLDAASAYKVQPGSFHLPFIPLPKDINLSGENLQSAHRDISLSIEGKTYFPEPLIYYSSVLKGAPNPAGAALFDAWLSSAEAQEIFRRYSYDLPGHASALRA